MAIEKSLVSGSMTMLILKLLSEKDMYRYESKQKYGLRKYRNVNSQIDLRKGYVWI